MKNIHDDIITDLLRRHDSGAAYNR